MVNQKRKSVLQMVQLAMLTALVVVLQLVGSFIKIGPLPLSLVLVPIVIGATLLGPKAGLFFCSVFGVITMIMGIAGVDGFSFILWGANPVWFVIICLLKAAMAGLGSGLIYKGLGKLFKGKHITLQTVLASISAPIINTGIFVIGMFLFFFDTMNSLPSMYPDTFGGFENAFQLVFIGLAGFNFIGEFIVNLVLSPAVVRVVDLVKKNLKV